MLLEIRCCYPATEKKDQKIEIRNLVSGFVHPMIVGVFGRWIKKLEKHQPANSPAALGVPTRYPQEMRWAKPRQSLTMPFQLYVAQSHYSVTPLDFGRSCS